MHQKGQIEAEEFVKLSKHLPDMIYQFMRRPDGTYCLPIASIGIKNIFGCDPEDVRESFDPIVKVIHPDDLPKVVETIEYASHHLTEFVLEYRVCLPGKPIQWIYSRSTPEKLPDGSIIAYGFTANIMEQKIALEKIEKLAQKQEAILKAIPFLVFEIGADKVIYDFHSQSSDMLYASPESFLGKKYYEILPKEAAAILDIALEEAIQKGYSNGLQYQLDVPQGRSWFELTLTHIKHKSVEDERFMMLARDITEKKLENDQLLRLSHAVEQSTSSIVITNLDGNLIYVNQQFLDITGYTEEEVIGHNPRILNSGYTKKEDYKAMWNTIKSGRTWHGEFLNRKKNGTTFWEDVTISPVKDEEGRIINFLAIKTDITKQRKTAEKLRKIVWNQSHLVRGPLTDILGIINILKMENSPDEKTDLLKQLEIAAKQLDQVIHKVIDETKKPV